MRNGIGKKLSRMIFGTNSYQADDIYQIEDEKTLNSIAWENSDSAVRSAAIDRINSQDPLENIAQNHHDNMARLQAVKRIESQEVLEIIAASDKDANVRLWESHVRQWSN